MERLKKKAMKNSLPNIYNPSYISRLRDEVAVKNIDSSSKMGFMR